MSREFSGGWSGRILRVDLSRGSHSVRGLDPKAAVELLGGRGLAVKILWDELEPGTDPLSPDNVLVLAVGPLTGFQIPSSGKMVIASKSPLTGGYGDGNVGTRASVQLKRAGYDAVVIYGRAPHPSVLVIEDDSVQVKPAGDLWGADAYSVEETLEEEHPGAGVLCIGPAGERMARITTVLSERGRAGGRPGMGAVMGSKNLKAVVIKGTGELRAADPDRLADLGREGYQFLRQADGYEFWMRQGTMMTVEWCQENSALPTYNFREGVFDGWEGISGYVMEERKVGQKGCPNCNMVCGMVCEVRSGPMAGRRDSELDYENCAMLGSNLGIGDMDWVLTLNLLADEKGLDTISLGSVLGFATEAVQRGLISEEKAGRLRWGDGEAMLSLAESIASAEGFGAQAGMGVRALSQAYGGEGFAMHVKGLEISAYDCHTTPGMALAFGTSPIGAHHKDAWFISWELKMGRDLITREKVERLVEMQRIRGGFFECAGVCRLPWIELGLPVDWYVRCLNAATGLEFTEEDIWGIADRVYALMRAFWVREYAADGRGWGREMDVPPARWFDEPLTKGPFAGEKLSREAYDRLLSWYYELRGWNERGIPRRSTLESLGLGYVAEGLERVGVSLS